MTPSCSSAPPTLSSSFCASHSLTSAANSACEIGAISGKLEPFQACAACAGGPTSDIPPSFAFSPSESHLVKSVTLHHVTCHPSARNPKILTPQNVQPRRDPAARTIVAAATGPPHRNGRVVEGGLPGAQGQGARGEARPAVSHLPDRYVTTAPPARGCHRSKAARPFRGQAELGPWHANR